MTHLIKQLDIISGFDSRCVVGDCDRTAYFFIGHDGPYCMTHFNDYLIGILHEEGLLG